MAKSNVRLVKDASGIYEFIGYLGKTESASPQLKLTQKGKTIEALAITAGGRRRSILDIRAKLVWEEKDPRDSSKVITRHYKQMNTGSANGYPGLAILSSWGTYPQVCLLIIGPEITSS